MGEFLMYHNPSCSKSRGAQDILRQHDQDFDVIEYLNEPLTRADFEQVLDLLIDPPADLVRKDKRFTELGLQESDYQNRDEIIEVLLQHPELMQRPVIIRGRRALIAVHRSGSSSCSTDGIWGRYLSDWSSAEHSSPSRRATRRRIGPLAVASGH